MRRRSRIALLAAGVIAAATLAAGCGAQDFPNNPRPPAPIELTAKVGNGKVVVSPTTLQGKPIGAGLANVTIANLTDRQTTLDFSGPTHATTDPVVANGTLNYKLDLRPGNYVVSAGGQAVRPMEFQVGPERPSSQNDLLLP